MTWSIRVDDLSKLYRIGTDAALVTTLYQQTGEWFRERILRQLPKSRRVGRPARDDHHVVSPRQLEDAPPEHFWALRNIAFEVGQGDRVGVIGRNGSGKSTLLRILSRITTPTTGSFRYRGRLVSLLEVGTGFHAELSGRENIYLNGQINGMTTREINRKFDEILEFSELGEQINTPVKRYSSGMYMRLAFAVAAHLESEILIVDEVLAVGDINFQRKCSEKMLAVANEGRTVLFVSHNMEAINSICNYAIELSHGRMVRHDRTSVDKEDGADQEISQIRLARDVTNDYLRSAHNLTGERFWATETAPNFDESVFLLGVRVCDRSGATRTEFDVNDDVVLEMRFTVRKKKWAVNAHIYLRNLAEEKLFVSMDNLDVADPDSPREPGTYVERCIIAAPLLNEGQYSVEALICTHPTSIYNLVVPYAVGFIVTDDKRRVGVRGNWLREWPSYLLRPRLQWIVQFEPGFDDERTP